jgi:cytochrome P450
MAHPTIYHQLLKSELHPNGVVPEADELFEESQALMFGGADTTGTTMMHGCFHLLKTPDVLSTLQTELQRAWPDLNRPPSYAELERLPFLVRRQASARDQ